MKAIPHIVWAIVAIALCAGFYLWLQEHDKKLSAELQIKNLQSQIDGRNKQAEKKIGEIRDRANKVKEPEQAVAAMPNVVNLPSSIGRLRDLLPGVVLPPNQQNAAFIPQESVAPLFQNLSKCREDQVALGACQQNIKDKDEQLKKLDRGGFMRRLEDCGMDMGTNAGTGALAAKASKGSARDGAIIGLGVGGLKCLLLRRK